MALVIFQSHEGPGDGFLGGVLYNTLEHAIIFRGPNKLAEDKHQCCCVEDCDCRSHILEDHFFLLRPKTLTVFGRTLRIHGRRPRTRNTRWMEFPFVRIVWKLYAQVLSWSYLFLTKSLTMRSRRSPHPE